MNPQRKLCFSCVKKKHVTHEEEFSPVLTIIHLWSVSTPLVQGPGWAGASVGSQARYILDRLPVQPRCRRSASQHYIKQRSLLLPQLSWVRSRRSLNVRMATFRLVWLWESLAGSPGKWSDWVRSSIWLSYWCLPRLLPAEERFCSYQRRVTCLRSSCHQVSSQSGPREHLSPSLNWLQHLIKALLRDEGDKNDAPLLRGRRTLKENVLPANYLYSLFGRNTPKPPAYSKLGLQLWALLLYFCQHSSLWCSICPISLSIHSPPTFPCIVNLIPQWAEHKELTRPPWSHIPDAA